MACNVRSLLLAIILPSCVSIADDATRELYISPYKVQYSFSIDELIGDILRGPRGDARKLSSVPFDEWYSPTVKKRWGAWGPPFVHQPPPLGIKTRSTEYQRQRVIAAGMRYVGISYQHHHLPDWDPPADWPWKEVGCGENCRGIDCSNFTSFVYNQALGLKPSAAIQDQAAQGEVEYTDGRKLVVERIERPKSYDEFSEKLRTGDLLFIENSSKTVSHVVFWIGSIGSSPDNTPLILDSTGAGHRDCEGQSIPDGVQLRPFTKRSWYYKSSVHAFRLIP